MGGSDMNIDQMNDSPSWSLLYAEVISCPACHELMEPEYRALATRGRSWPGEVAIRARCRRCGRLWKGHLNLVDENRINA